MLFRSYSKELIGDIEIVQIETISKKNDQVLTSENLQLLLSNQEKQESLQLSENIRRSNRSSFAPFRLVQALGSAVSKASDFLFFIPLAGIVSFLQYHTFAMTGKSVFESVAKLPTNGATIPSTQIDSLVLHGIARNKKEVTVRRGLQHIRNIKKSFYLCNLSFNIF